MLTRLCILALFAAFPLAAEAQRFAEQDETCGVAPPDDGLIGSMLGLTPAARVRVGCARDGISLTSGYPVPEALLRFDRTGASGWFYTFMVVAPYEVPEASDLGCEPVDLDDDGLFSDQMSDARKCSFESHDDRGEWTYELSLVTMTDESLPDERESVVMGRMTVVLVPHQ